MLVPCLLHTAVSIDSFVKYFRQELDIFGIKYQYVDERIYLKYVKHFFLAKGSEAAYGFYLEYYLIVILLY